MTIARIIGKDEGTVNRERVEGSVTRERVEGSVTRERVEGSVTRERVVVAIFKRLITSNTTTRVCIHPF